MATLFERISGHSENGKIAIHLIRGCCSEIYNGRMTFARAVELMELDQAQSLDLQTVLAKASTATNSITFSNVLFSWLTLAEMGVPEYMDESAFWLMVDQEAAK